MGLSRETAEKLEELRSDLACSGSNDIAFVKTKLEQLIEILIENDERSRWIEDRSKHEA